MTALSSFFCPVGGNKWRPLAVNIGMTDNNKKYGELRERYPLFEYVGYHYEFCDEGLRLRFDFRMGEVEFTPTALFERRPFLSREVSVEALERMVFDIGMVELVSYWKCACPPTVRVCCGSLSAEQVAFWTKLYWNGLGEFFYTNGIAESPEGFLKVESGKWKAGSGKTAGLEGLSTFNSQLSSYLVPIGGGKDSVVTLELLRQAGKSVRPLIMNPRGATVECARVGGFAMDEVIVIRRTIDPTLLELNRQGYLNGHTPFSAMLAFYTRLASLLSGVANVALSNESSANESTVPGSTVNHQYSKSLEFENDFRRYVSDERLVMSDERLVMSDERLMMSDERLVMSDERLMMSDERLVMSDELAAAAPGISSLITHHSSLITHHSSFNYFSFLRPLSELQIAMLFSRMEQYHDVFRSCNVGSKQDIWCGHCAKCLFAYIILSPFIAPDRLNRIFGKSMLDDLSLRTEFRQLCGEEATKPFECVGTVSEVRQALQMAVARWYKDKRPALLSDERLVMSDERLVMSDERLAMSDELAAAAPGNSTLITHHSSFTDSHSSFTDNHSSLDTLLPIGNLTSDERAILQQACTAKNN